MALESWRRAEFVIWAVALDVDLARFVEVTYNLDPACGSGYWMKRVQYSGGVNRGRTIRVFRSVRQQGDPLGASLGNMECSCGVVDCDMSFHDNIQ